jgi:hypothetical protein
LSLMFVILSCFASTRIPVVLRERQNCLGMVVRQGQTRNHGRNQIRSVRVCFHPPTFVLRGSCLAV